MGKNPCRKVRTAESRSSSRGSPGSPGLSVWRPGLVGLGVVALAAFLTLGGRPLAPFLSDVGRVRRFVASFGVWAPLALISLEVAQVVLAPVPGGVIDLASGYLFGPGWGTLYSMTGLMGGTVIALGLARRFGRPLVERLVPSRTLNRLDRYARHRGAFFFLLLFLMPFTPNDAVCFLAGLTPLPVPLLLLIAAVGRLPGVLTTNLIGANVATFGLRQLLLMGVPLLSLILGLWRSEERVERFLLRLAARLDELVRR